MAFTPTLNPIPTADGSDLVVLNAFRDSRGQVYKIRVSGEHDLSKTEGNLDELARKVVRAWCDCMEGVANYNPTRSEAGDPSRFGFALLGKAGTRVVIPKDPRETADALFGSEENLDQFQVAHPRAQIFSTTLGSTSLSQVDRSVRALATALFPHKVEHVRAAAVKEGPKGRSPRNPIFNTTQYASLKPQFEALLQARKRAGQFPFTPDWDCRLTSLTDLMEDPDQISEERARIEEELCEYSAGENRPEVESFLKAIAKIGKEKKIHETTALSYFLSILREEDLKGVYSLIFDRLGISAEETSSFWERMRSMIRV